MPITNLQLGCPDRKEEAGSTNTGVMLAFEIIQKTSLQEIALKY